MKGSCLCQAVEYHIDALISPIAYCHCGKCRKAHAAPFNATAGADRAGFRWTKGEAQLGAFESSPGKQRWFCRNCGSHLMAEWTDKPYVIIRVATLDEDPQAEIRGHIWVSHDLPWLDYGEQIARYPEKP